jgi:hypothetical protein
MTAGCASPKASFRRAKSCSCCLPETIVSPTTWVDTVGYAATSDHLLAEAGLQRAARLEGGTLGISVAGRGRPGAGD